MKYTVTNTSEDGENGNTSVFEANTPEDAEAQARAVFGEAYPNWTVTKAK